MKRTGGPCFVCANPVDYGSLIHQECKEGARINKGNRINAVSRRVK